MAKGSTLLANSAVRALLVGYPGAGKTGSLACLLNAGFKIRMLDYDGNTEPLIRWANPAMLDNLDVLYFEDKKRVGSGFHEPIGIPSAFANGLKAMDKWEYEENGVTVDLGSSKDWGPDTIVVLDSLTSMGDASMDRAMKLSNKTKLNNTDRVWGLAMGEQHEFIKKLTSPSNRFHVIVLAHLKMIGPKDIRHGDSQLTQDIKQQVGSMIETRLFPSALGWQLPQVIGGEFPTLLEITSSVRAGHAKRVIRTVPRPELDVKLPAVLAEKELDITDGMLHIFRALSPQSVALVQGETNK